MAHRTILPEKSVHPYTEAISYGVRVVDVKMDKIILQEELFWLLRNEILFHVFEKMAYVIFIWLFWYIFKKKKKTAYS